MLNSISDIAMFMLYLVLAYLLLTNAGAFNTMLNTVGSNWRTTLAVLQGNRTS
jgi:hypothetical protein